MGLEGVFLRSFWFKFGETLNMTHDVKFFVLICVSR